MVEADPVREPSSETEDEEFEIEEHRESADTRVTEEV